MVGPDHGLGDSAAGPPEHGRLAQKIEQGGAIPVVPQPSERWDAAGQCLAETGVSRVGGVHDPVPAALEDRHLRGDARERAGDLHAGRTGADDCHPTADEPLVVVPTGRVERRPGERLEAGQVGDPWPVENAGGADEDVRLVHGPIVTGHVPAPAVPARLGDLRPERDVGPEAVTLHDAFDVRADLVPRGEEAIPAGVEVEGVLVEATRDIARQPRIAVVVPRPADAGRLLVEREVGETLRLQGAGHPDSGDPAADDQDPRFALGHVPTPDRQPAGGPGHTRTQAVE
ncbi:unannotated protein [freshwater metagenome]|uniref:Unannotated protein n=1 Tax=freshwater metagenome TaxID=449393 RepID=A0A6J7JNZ1_9ZZZZ